MKFFTFLLILFSTVIVYSQVYPDQHYVLRIDSLYSNIESSSGIKLSENGKFILLEDGAAEGYFITKPQFSQQPFNQGLPSWNGTAKDAAGAGAFKVQMRFPFGTGWSPWLTVGFWKNNVWTSYGQTSYTEGFIDYDYVKLNVYKNSWQFKVILTRTSANRVSPTIHKLSFFVSDSRTTANVNYTQIVNDNPAAVFIPTTFIYQYAVDPQIGGSICSPTTVSMIMKSYNIPVDPYQFALTTYDPYYKIFGIWPRVVQNASESGLDGAVTRYRTWSEVREVLAAGGRVGISVGLPLYTGHLMMFAGFNSSGTPIIHDPARSNGYSYVFNESELAQSWFGKGGVAYTFYPADSAYLDAGEQSPENLVVKDFELFQNYPNPFNPTTTISFSIPEAANVKLTIYDMLGREVVVLADEYISAGYYKKQFNAGSLSSGTYIVRMQAGEFNAARKIVLVR